MKRSVHATEEKEGYPSKKRKYRSSKVLKPPFKLETLDDLLDIAWNYTGDEFDWFRLWKLIPVIMEVKDLVGLNDFKQLVINYIIYFLSGYHEKDELLHTVVYGEPGIGKTHCINLLAKIYAGLGLTKTETIVTLNRQNSIGPFIGHTEKLFSSLVEKATGGVLLIDEVYALGNGSSSDNFSVGLVNMLNQELTEGKFLCIIAGYEKQIRESFFEINEGLESRFPRIIRLPSADAKDMRELFLLKLKMREWGCDEDALSEKFFETYKEKFPHTGRNIVNFISMCKDAYARRNFGMRKHGSVKLLSKTDIEKACIAFFVKKKEHLSYYS
jgi:replication-associated recombination protein RarA